MKIKAIFDFKNFQKVESYQKMWKELKILMDQIFFHLCEARRSFFRKKLKVFEISWSSSGGNSIRTSGIDTLNRILLSSNYCCQINWIKDRQIWSCQNSNFHRVQFKHILSPSCYLMTVCPITLNKYHLVIKYAK